MKEKQDYLKDISQIRSMMERSTKFVSLSGLAGVMAGIYALGGVYTAYYIYGFNPDQLTYSVPTAGGLPSIILLGVAVLILALGTAIVLSTRKAHRQGDKAWNAISRRLLTSMAVPLITGGALILFLWAEGLAGLAVPLTLIFYGLAIYNSSQFTFSEMKFLGFIQIGMGLLSLWFIGYSLLLWALGFGVVHIVYGIIMHFKYER